MKDYDPDDFYDSYRIGEYEVRMPDEYDPFPGELEDDEEYYIDPLAEFDDPNINSLLDRLDDNSF